MRRNAAVGMLVWWTLTAGACGNDGGSAANGGDALEGRTFLSQSVELDDSDPAVEVPHDSIRLEFTDGEVRAHAGCNHLFGEVTSTAGGRLSIGPMGGTEMGCPEELHARDDFVIAFLTSEPGWVLDEDTLVLTTQHTTITLLDRRVADPDRPLEATRWVVDTIIDGETASSLPTDAQAWLRLEDGALTGFTGCNELSGSYRLDGEVLHVDPLIQTDAMCQPDVMILEEAISVISDTRVEYSITATRLNLLAPDGTGLGLHADE